MKIAGVARVLLVSGCILGSAFSPVHAQAEESATPSTSVTEEAEVSRGLYDKAWSVTPRVGLLSYRDSDQVMAGRMTEGVTTNLMMGRWVEAMPSIDFGLESGLMFSHLGSPGANSFGMNAPIQVAESANTLQVPINLVLAYRPHDRVLLASNVGTSMIYRSVGNSMLLGRASDGSSSSATDFFPNVGLNLGWAVTRSVGISLRGDWILTPATDIYNASIGAQIALG